MTAPAPASPAEFVVEGAPTYDRRTPVRWVLSHLWRYPGLLLGAATLVVLQSVITSSLARLTGLAFDAVIGGGTQLPLVAGAILAAAILQGVTDLGGAFGIEMLAQRLERDARDELYVSLLGKSQTFHDRQRVGDIMARAANDVRQLNPMINPGAGLIFDSILGTIVPVVFIATVDPRLLAAPLLFVATFAVALRRYMAELEPVSMEMRVRFGALNSGLNETISGIEVVKSVVAEAREKEKFLREATRYRDQFVLHSQVQARYLPVLLIGVAAALGFGHGVFLVARGELSVGELVAFLGLMNALRFPAFISIFTFSLVQMGLAGAERILDVMRQRTELDENAGGHAAPVVGDVRFEGVRFGYGGDRDDQLVLRDVSFHVPAGSTVAIVGQTGSGKSTLTRLVNRIHDVSAGRILVDGVDVRDWNLESLRSQISVIEQDVFLFSRTIRENIAFGLGDRATPEAVERAARAAQAHEFIVRFADGYDTVVGERGVTLSGGQRQRLAIARALLTDPRILVLDDSTSAIDSATEDRIQRAIAAVLEGRTTFVITHRLSQIRRADLILVLHQGRLVDQGTHDELLERCALYARIFGRRPPAAAGTGGTAWGS